VVDVDEVLELDGALDDVSGARVDEVVVVVSEVGSG
jgi:hypothetical protein